MNEDISDKTNVRRINQYTYLTTQVPTNGTEQQNREVVKQRLNYYSSESD